MKDIFIRIQNAEMDTFTPKDNFKPITHFFPIGYFGEKSKYRTYIRQAIANKWLTREDVANFWIFMVDNKPSDFGTLEKFTDYFYEEGQRCVICDEQVDYTDREALYRMKWSIYFSHKDCNTLWREYKNDE